MSVRIKSERTRFTDNAGNQEWVLIYELDKDDVKKERAKFLVSTDNILPGHSTTDIYAPCIHASSIDNDSADQDGKLVTCMYRRPTRQMILRPGRGLMEFRTYSSVRNRETPVFTRRSFTQQADIVISEGFPTHTLEKKAYREVLQRAVHVIRTTDWARNEAALMKRAEEWIGMGSDEDTGITYDGETYDNLKCASILIQRRPGNISVVDAVYEFIRKPEGWEEEGIPEREWYACDIDGTEIDYDETTIPPVDITAIEGGIYFAVELFNADADVIGGRVNFTKIEEYFTWL